MKRLRTDSLEIFIRRPLGAVIISLFRCTRLLCVLSRLHWEQLWALFLLHILTLRLTDQRCLVGLASIEPLEQRERDDG